MANTTNTTPSLGAKTGTGANSTTKAAVFGYILGLATAGILYLVTKGKGKRSNGSRSALPEPYDDATLLPPPSPAVDAHDNEGMTDVTLPTEPATHAPAGVAKRKLTDEEVALIRAWYNGGVPAKEIAARLSISVKTVYARLSNNNNPEKPKNDDRK